MKRIDKMTVEEIEAYLKERKNILSNVPNPIREPDYTMLKSLVVQHIKNMASDDYCEDNDDKEYIYEEAIAAVYGPDVFKWINARLV